MSLLKSLLILPIALLPVALQGPWACDGTGWLTQCWVALELYVTQIFISLANMLSSWILVA